MSKIKKIIIIFISLVLALTNVVSVSFAEDIFSEGVFDDFILQNELDPDIENLDISEEVIDDIIESETTPSIEEELLLDEKSTLDEDVSTSSLVDSEINIEPETTFEESVFIEEPQEPYSLEERINETLSVKIEKASNHDFPFTDARLNVKDLSSESNLVEYIQNLQIEELKDYNIEYIYNISILPSNYDGTNEEQMTDEEKAMYYFFRNERTDADIAVTFTSDTEIFKDLLIFNVLTSDDEKRIDCAYYSEENQHNYRFTTNEFSTFVFVSKKQEVEISNEILEPEETSEIWTEPESEEEIIQNTNNGYSIKDFSRKEFLYEDSDIIVSVTTAPENRIPNEAVLVVQKINEDTNTYVDYLQSIADLYSVNISQLEIIPYDIHFEYNQEEIEPENGSLKIQFVFKDSIDISVEDQTSLVHISDDGTTEEVLNQLTESDEITDFEFELSSFSGVVVTRLLAATNTTDIFAILYSNGDLVFQIGDEPDESRGSVVSQWTGFNNTNSHPWSSNVNIKNIFINTPIKPTSCASYFYNMDGLVSITGLENIDTSSVTTMSQMFYDCDNLTSIDLSNLDTSNVTSFNQMFQSCDRLNSFTMNNNDTTKITNLNQMFYSCPNLVTVNMDTCDFNKVTSAYSMFYSDTSLTTLLCSNWGMNALSSAYYMFYCCYDLKNINVDKWTPSKLYTAYYMFYNCRNLETLDLSGWNVAGLYSSYYMFAYCSKLVVLYAPNWTFANNSTMYYMFSNCPKLSVLDLSGWNVPRPGTSYYLFYNDAKLGYVDLSGFNNSAGQSTQYDFYNTGLSRITLGENWRFSGGTSNVYQLPAGEWMRESTGDIYTASELLSTWNSTMADTYSKVTSVTFDGNGGNATKKKYVLTLGQSLEELPGATRDGYAFVGWFTLPSGGTEIHDGDSLTQSVYYAHWNENTYTLILKRNVDDDPNDTEERIVLPYTQIYTLDSTLFENDDKVLQGWALSPDGPIVYGPNENVVMLSQETNGIYTLYAKWGRTRNATVSFDSQGGNEIDNILVEKGQTLDYKFYQTPVKTGYTFRGWYTGENGTGTRYDTVTRVIDNDITLYAYWVKDPVISFNPNGGWVETFTRIVPYNTAIGALPNADARPRKLIGYFTSPNPGEGTKLTTTKVFTADATYWAHWGYQPFFNTNGGKFTTSFNVDSVYPVDYPEEQILHTLPSVSRDGYTFVHWELADGTVVNTGDVVNLHDYPELVAIWEKTDVVTVTFNTNGGSFSGNATSKYDMKKNTVLEYYPLVTRNINGRRAEFLGWYTEDDVLYTPETIIEEDTTLIAKWAEKSYKLTFVPGDGSAVASTNGSGTNTRWLSDGEPLGIIPGSKLDGYYLEGWYSEPDGAGTKLTENTTVTEDTTWYAHWINNRTDKINDDVAYKFLAEWSNASNDNVDNAENNLNFHPTSDSTQTASLHLHFELNSQVSNTLPTGSVRIRVPQYIWKNWTDANTGTNNLSSQMSEFPKISSGMYFSYYKDGDDYVIINNQPLAGGAGIDMTISYQVTPSNVPGGAIDVNGDYIDGYPYYTGNIPVDFCIDTDFVIEDGKTAQTSTFIPEVEEVVPLTVEMHTKVPATISKSYNSLYYEWQSSWGAKPADADDYFYIAWVTTAATSNASQPWRRIISEDTVHDGTVVYGDSSVYPSSTGYQTGSTTGTLTTITKHSKKLLEDIPATGITITNESKRTTIWRSGYEETLAAKASYTLRNWEYTKGEFDKNNLSTSVRTITGGQESILNNEDVSMQWQLYYDGVSRDTALQWHEETGTYTADQRIISVADGMNGDLFYSSGSPNAKYVWEPTSGNYALTDEDYTITNLSIMVREYDGSYYNSEWGGPVVNTEYAKWKDVDIYVRYKDTDELVLWKSVHPTSGSISVTLPNNVNGYEVRYPSSYYRTYLNTTMTILLHPTAKIRSMVYSDSINNATSIIKNRGYCNIWTSNDPYSAPDGASIMYDTNSWTEHNVSDSVFFHVTDYLGGFNGANKEIYELNKSTVSLYAQKFSSAQGNVLFDVERGYQENPMAIRGWTYANSGKTKYIKTGTFYDLLPTGATVPEDSIFGILTSSNQNGTTSTNIANSYTSYKSQTSQHLAKEYYDVQFIENWENSGRTMMVIRFMVPENLQRNMATFYYLLKMTYTDVVNFGTTIENDVAFTDDSIRDYEYSYSYNSPSVITEQEYYNMINYENDWVAHSTANTNYIPVDAFSWGFDKTVNTRTDYVTEDITIPNNEYTYKLNFSQSDYATSDSIVFYDVLETGAYDNDGELEKPSEWYGYFESIDISSVQSKLKDGTTDVYCAPVVYYSTKEKDAFTGADYNIENTATWTTICPQDKEEITAIAVDCRFATDGSAFVQKGRQSMAIYITMRAPVDSKYIGKTAVNQAKLIARVYDDNPPDNPSEATSDTEVTLEDEEPEIHKESDPESGTEEEPTIIGYGDDLTYTIRVTNKNENFTVRDFVVEDETPDGVQVKTSEIKVHFGNPENAASINVSPRVDLKVKNGKLTFTINSLEAGETVYIIIPTKVVANGNDGPFDNTAIITSVNGIEKEITSETTWHEVQYDVIFSKQSDIKQLVPGAHLELYDVDTEELIEEWTTAKANKTIRLYIGNFVLKETEVPDGYAIADDVYFSVQPDGTILYADESVDTKVVMVDVASVEVRGQKHWKWDEESDRPDSIRVILQRNGIDYKEQVTSATEDWKYDFGKVPKYDNNKNEYIYTVVEVPVDNYTPQYTDSIITDALAVTFNTKTSTYDSNDYFEVYYEFEGKMFRIGKYYGKNSDSTNPANTTIYIPSDNFYVYWHSNNANNDYGFKIDSILPTNYETRLVGTRMNLPSGFVVEEVTGNKYPETDHEYFINEDILWHYSRDMEGQILDIVNTKNSDGFDVEIYKISEKNELLGGVELTVSSDENSAFEPITITTIADEPSILHLTPGVYTLHEVTPLNGYLTAEDIIFTVNQYGELYIDQEQVECITMLDKDTNQPYPFNKVWMDAGFESLRPDSVTFELIRRADDVVVATKVLTAENETSDTVWSGYFDNIPLEDDAHNPIEYYVREIVDNDAYRVLYDTQNKKGLIVTFTEDSDIGDGQLFIYLYGKEEYHGDYWYRAQGTLMLNPLYNLPYLEETDMAGKSFYVPIIDGVEGFVISTSWASNSQKVEIASIVPTNIEQPYETMSYGGPLSGTVSAVYTGKNYPVLDGDVKVQYIWNSTATNAYPTAEITNYVNKINVPFEKYWDDAQYTDERPETITFDLYNTNDLENIISSMTVDVTDEDISEYEFTDVPKYNDDWSIAEYLVKERPVEHYKSTSAIKNPQGFLVHFSNDSDAGDGFVALLGRINNYLNGPYAFVDTGNDGTTYTAIYGNSMADKTYFVQVMDDLHPSFALYVSDSSKTAHVTIDSIVPVDYNLETTSIVSGMPIYMVEDVCSGSTYPSITLDDETKTYRYSLYEYEFYNQVYNTIDYIDFPVTKLWSDANERPDSIIVQVYNVNDINTIIKEIELTSEDAVSDDEWNTIIRKLPRFNSDGTPAQYAVKEKEIPENYKAFYGKPKGMLVTFTDDSFAGHDGSQSYIMLSSVNLASDVCNEYITPQELTTAPYIYGHHVTGNTFYVPIVGDGGYAFAVCNGYYTNTHIEIESVRLTTEEYPVIKSNMGMPLSGISTAYRYEGTGSYDMTGKGGWHLYTYTGAVGNLIGSGEGTILNEYNITSLPVSKIWVDTGHETERPESISLTAYNKHTPTIPAGSVTLTYENLVADYEWDGMIENLPKYNDDGTLSEYIVKESSTDNYITHYEKPKGMLVTFSEDSFAASYSSSGIYLLSISARGETGIYYIYPSTTASSPYITGYDIDKYNREFYIPIEEDGVYSFAILNSGSTYTRCKIESVKLTTEERDVKKVSFILPLSNIPANHRYDGTNSFDMTGETGWYLYTYTGVTSGLINPINSNITSTITNEINLTDVPFTKSWIGDEDFKEYRPETLTFNLYNQTDLTTIIDSITLPVTENNTISGEFKDVPKYNENGTEIVYVVKEESVPAKYEATSSVNNIKGFLLTFSEDSDLTGGNLYIWQSDGISARNHIVPATSNYYSYWYQDIPIAGKTVYVPVYSPDVYEFCVELARTSSSYNPHYNITSIQPVYEDLECQIYTGSQQNKNYVDNPAYPNYEEVVNVNSLERNFTNYSSYNVIYTWVKWDVNTNGNSGVINTLKKHHIQFNKYSNLYAQLPGATLQIQKADSKDVIYEWETNTIDAEYELPAGNYILHEVSAPVGFDVSDDIYFTIDNNGVVTITNSVVGATVTNSTVAGYKVRMHDNELINLSGTKTWVGDDESDRATSITVNLLRNGIVVDSQIVTSDNNWMYHFDDLPKYANYTTTTPYSYTVSENPVIDYKQEYLDSIITNSWVANQLSWENDANNNMVTPVATETTTYSTPAGLRITFSSDSQTESTTYDWLYIYYKKNGTLYRLNTKYGGNGSSNNIANTSITVPSTDVYFVWRTDGSVTYYGWRIANIEPLTSASTPSNVTATSLPTSDNGYSYTTTNYTNSNYPQTGHQYGNNERKIYHYTYTNTIPTTVTTTTYTVSSEKGLQFKLNNKSFSELNCDYLYVYFKANGTWYRLPTQYSGSLLAGATITVPSTDVYFAWHTDGSVQYYGWDIVDVTEVNNPVVTQCMLSSLPSYTQYEFVGNHYPSTSHPTANSENIIYHYHINQSHLPDDDDRYASTIVSDIKNTRLPDKFNVEINKINPENETIAGAQLEITGHETNASYDIEPIRWTSTTEPQIVELRQGEYILHESVAPSGYLIARDISFTIDENNQIFVNGENVNSVTMTDKHNLQNIPVNKTWDDTGFEQYRPDSIIFDLYDINDMDTIVQSLIRTADTGWSGEFIDVPIIYEDTGESIEYTVVERAVEYYNTSYSDGDSALPSSYTWQPKHGMQINFSDDTHTNGPLMVVWKDRMSDKWFSNSYGVGSNSVMYMSAQEIYLLYRSFGPYTGLDIDSIELVTGYRSNWSLSGGYLLEGNSFDEVIEQAMNYYSNSSSYWPTLPFESDFIDGSNGYHNSVADEDYANEVITQYVKLVLPSEPAIITSAPTWQEVSQAEGFQITLGDDGGMTWGPACIVWKDEDTNVYRNLYLSSGTYNVKSKEFYLCFADSSTHTVGSSGSIYGTNYSISSISTISDASWITASNSYNTAEAAINGYGGNYFRNYVMIDGRSGASLRNTANGPIIYSFDYTQQYLPSSSGLLVTFAEQPSMGPLCVYYKENGVWQPHYYGNFGENASGNTYYIPSHDFYIAYTDYDRSGTNSHGYGYQITSIVEASDGAELGQDGTSVTINDIESGFTQNGPYSFGWYNIPVQTFTEDDYPSYISDGNTNGTAVIQHYVWNTTSSYYVTNTFNVHSFDVPFNKINEGGQKIDGAHLKLFDSNNTLVSEWDTVAGESHIETLDYGTYTISETTIPDGYLKSPDVAFTITPIGEITIGSTSVDSVSITDEDIVVEIIKKTSDGTVLSGAVLQLLQEDNTLVEEWTSTSSVKKFRNLSAGTYVLHEVTPPDGYLSANDIVFTVSNTTRKISINSDLYDNVVMIDMPIAIPVRKVDTNNQLIENAVLSLYDSNDTLVMSQTTNNSEPVIFAPVLPGTYTIRETGIPDFYKVASDIVISVDKDGIIKQGDNTITEVVMTDDLIEIPVNKISLDDEFIEDCHLQILHGSDVIEEWTTTDEAHIVSGKLIAGQVYTLHETSCPDDYVIADDITFTVTETGTIVINEEEYDAVTMVDFYSHNSLSISKTVAGNLGDKSYQFHFVLELDDDDVTELTLTKNEQSETMSINATGFFEFTLAHDEIITISDIPYNTKYEIKEVDGNSLGYKVESTNNKGILTENASVSFVNTRDMAVPTEARTGNLILVICLVSVGLGIVTIYVVKKKRRKE